MYNEKNNTLNTTSNTKTICKLGLDVHAASVTVGRQLEGMNPQPAQKFPIAQFLPWVRQQLEKGYPVISCYESRSQRLLAAS